MHPTQLSRKDEAIRPKQFERSTESVFSYPPLMRKDRFIRLIRIKPDLSPSGDVQCEICQASLDSTGYSCLSYVWGTKEATKTIVFGNALFEVRQNLWDFLWRARLQHQFTSTWLWIDALCINQSDAEERNHQVQQMGQIYSKAKEVISWLGISRLVEDLLADKIKPGHRDYHAAHEAFLENTYWTRAWVTQEVALACKVTVMAGHTGLDLESAIGRLRGQHHFYYWEYHARGIRRHTVTQVPTSWTEFKHRSLPYILHECRWKKCEAYQDLVFSLLALCGDGAGLQVDYGYTRQQLALSVLYNCRKSFCLCSFLVVTSALQLHEDRDWTPTEDSRRGFNKIPVIECTLPVSTLEKGGTESRTITMDLNTLCARFEGSITLRVTQRTNIISSITYSTPRMRQGLPARFYSAENRGSVARELGWKETRVADVGITARPSKDDLNYTLEFTLAALLHVVRVYSLMPGNCERVRSLGTDTERDFAGPALRFCTSSCEVLRTQ